MKPLDLILSRLPDAKRNGDGYVARCPAHDDRNPSLSIREGDDGRALLHCHAGCTVEAVCAALKVKPADLFTPKVNGHKPSKALAKVAPATTYRTTEEAIAELERRHGAKSALWQYVNEAGEIVGIVVRWDQPGGVKDIRPVSRRGAGWSIGAMEEPRPLYRLADLAAASRVYVCEGEKAADAARSIGLIATTSSGGAKAAHKTDWSPLIGKEVVILPDNDDAGGVYARNVASILTKLENPMVKIAELDGLPHGGDIYDWLEARDAQEPDELRPHIEALADAAPVWKPEAPAPKIEPYRPFPVKVLPEPLRSFVVTASRAIGCDPAYIALPLLAALASAIGNTRRIRLKRSWREPAILWCVIVGWSGTAKSPAIDAPLEAIRRKQNEGFKQFKADMAAYSDAMERFRDEKKKRKQDGRDYGDLKPPEKPVCVRFWCSDVTIEALADRLGDAPRGLLLVRDELAGWLNSFGQYKSGKGGDEAHWLELHRAGHLMVDRKTGDKTTISVPRAAICICGGIQPVTLARALGREHFENGLAARLLLAMPPRIPRRWTDLDIPDELHIGLANVFDQLLSIGFDTDAQGEDYPADVKLSPEAQRRFMEYFNEHNAEQAELVGDEAAAWSKLEGGAARLALVIHCARWAAGDPTLRGAFECDEESIEAGIVLARWFGQEAKRIYAVLGESDEDRERSRLIEWLQRRGKPVTVRDLTHGLRQFREDHEAAQAALDELDEAGVGRWMYPPQNLKGGRQSPQFKLVAAVTVTETPTDDSTNEGNGDGDAGDGGWDLIHTK